MMQVEHLHIFRTVSFCLYALRRLVVIKGAHTHTHTHTGEGMDLGGGVLLHTRKSLFTQHKA